MIRLDAFHVLTVSMLLPCLSTSCCGSQEAVLLTTDFESDPLASGWIFDGDNAKATWVDQGRNGGKCISLAEGFWESAPIPVTPYQYYKVTFHSKAEGRGYWAAINYDADGKALDADHHWGVDPSEDWLETTYCTRAKADAASIRFRFQPREEKRLTVDDVKVETVSREDVAKWADEVYATIPPVNIQPPENRWQFLPRTMQKLREGGTIRVVMLGDSIMNDTGNSPFDVLLERLYPRAHIEVITSVRGGTGTSYYKGENLVKQYVLDYNPDFLIIGGISNGRAEATRSVIQQVRAVIDPEIMVTTGAVCTGMDPHHK